MTDHVMYYTAPDASDAQKVEMTRLIARAEMDGFSVTIDTVSEDWHRVYMSR